MSSGAPRLVTVALPFRNAETTLAVAVTSILEQSYPHWELVLVDDGSTDGSRAVVEQVVAGDARVTIAAGTGAPGLPARLNQLIAMANGELFARMDADDVAYPERLERQVDFLDRQPSVDLIGSATVVFAGDGVVRGLRRAPTRHEQICARPTAGFKLYHPTWLGRTGWFKRHGYRPRRRCEDQDLLLRTFETSVFANLEEPLLGYREDRIDLRASLCGRRSFAGSVMDVRGGDNRRLEAAGAVVEQALKGTAEAMAVALRVDHLLRHRAGPISEQQRRRFERLWDEVTQAAAARLPTRGAW